MKPFEINVSSKHGAPMGRPSDPISGPVRLEKVPFVDGDYDPGGAYWGGGPEPLFCAWNEEGASYFRAENLEAAKAQLVGCEVVEGGPGGDSYLDQFFVGYVECALWSSNDESDERGGDPMDDNYSPDDVAPESLAAMREDCKKFIKVSAKDLADMDPERAGHDFWLTRNGHGTGFWDRGLGDVGTRFTAGSKAFGECNLWIGDDSKIHVA